MGLISFFVCVKNVFMVFFILFARFFFRLTEAFSSSAFKRIMYVVSLGVLLSVILLYFRILNLSVFIMVLIFCFFYDWGCLYAKK